MGKLSESLPLLIFLMALQHGFTLNDTVKYIEENAPIEMPIKAGQMLELRVEGLEDISFVLLETHAQTTALNLSLVPVWKHGYSTRGNDVGAIAMVTANQTYVSFYVNASRDTTAVVMATAYRSNSPIPGGCSSEFPLLRDPSIEVSVHNDKVVVAFQYANYGVAQGAATPLCEAAWYQRRLTYDVYQLFLPSRDWSEQTYLKAMQRLMRVEDIRHQTTKVKTLEYGKGKTRVSFAAYPGQGMMFGVIVKELDNDNYTLSAAYVPSVTYTCDFTADGQCADINDLPMQIVACILAVFGLMLCFAGHRYFKFSMFTFGMLAFGLLAYILITRFTTLDYRYTLGWSGLCGAFGGVLWLMLWCFVGVPVLSMVLAGLVMGFTVSSVVFNLTPLGLIDIFTTDFNYGLAFACGVLVPPVILLAFTKKLSLISCTIVGSYLVIAAIDSFLHSNVAYIVLNSIRKGAIPNYAQTLATMPLQLPGILLLIGWGVLVLVGLIIQSFTERDQPDFPACPYDRYKERQQHRRQMQELAGEHDVQEERRPLLVPSSRRRHYGRRASSVPQFQETPPQNASPPPAYNRLVDPL